MPTGCPGFLFVERADAVPVYLRLYRMALSSMTPIDENRYGKSAPAFVSPKPWVNSFGTSFVTSGFFS